MPRRSLNYLYGSYLHPQIIGEALLNQNHIYWFKNKKQTLQTKQPFHFSSGQNLQLLGYKWSSISPLIQKNLVSYESNRTMHIQLKTAFVMFLATSYISFCLCKENQRNHILLWKQTVTLIKITHRVIEIPGTLEVFKKLAKLRDWSSTSWKQKSPMTLNHFGKFRLKDPSIRFSPWFVMDIKSLPLS